MTVVELEKILADLPGDLEIRVIVDLQPFEINEVWRREDRLVIEAITK